MSQHLDALRRANEVRLAGCRLRAAVKALPQAEGAAAVATVLRCPDEVAGSIDVRDLVLSIRRAGFRTAGPLFTAADITKCQRVREVTPGRRERLAALVDSSFGAGEGER